MENDKLYLCLISIHGLIRGRDLELGRDADTGGQTKYVVELAEALACQPGVGRVDLLTRRVIDPAIHQDYAEPEEALAEGARILRVDAGPRGYIPKELLWDHLDAFVDNVVDLFKRQRRQPDLLHSHYADAGYVGSRLSHILDIPLIHTGHSLGRVKRRRLLASGLDTPQIEERYNMARRIEAEELTLASADRVITSTHQEIEEQYGLYDYYQPERMHVIPPGTDLTRFQPPQGGEWDAPIAAEIRRFLHDPHKPMILALSRPDARKNIAALIMAFGEDQVLREMANLVVVAGNRDDIVDLDLGAREVLTEILTLVDRYDLYGRVAYPKHHAADEVPLIYRLATLTGGVFVNPALTEPFGLTLIEAAASGLPIVATEDGGPRDIIGNCMNGLLIDPLDRDSIANAIKGVLSDWEGWQQRSANGLRGVREYYSWDAHAAHYLEMITPIVRKTAAPLLRPFKARRPMLYHDRAIFTDLDQNLLGDRESIPAFVGLVRENRKCASFGIATGRRLDSALKVMKQYGIPEPDILITSGGTAIHYAPKLTEDIGWRNHVEKQWTPKAVHRVLDGLPGLMLQPKVEQSPYKISYYIDPKKAPTLDEINQLLHKEEQSVNVVISFGQFLDVLPIRASKGMALRYMATRWDIPLEHILVAGGSGADEDMMRGNTLAVVVANRHHEELSRLAELERIYFAKAPFARGILEALDHYDFFGSCRVPESEAPE
ncbi:MAG: glycosyltransferase [Gammaproteobacteria bacterium]|nr:glycosyltransferase [Gammaproteobacteria bacterium]MBU1653379.1 glycosyltransferase [Gammaproteobacteria bacterium]MBU1960832.1 glycosyltransferase [Gammaproteobacteria bacterium]